MARKEATQKRRNKKRKTVNNRQPTAMKYSRYSESMLCAMADYNVSRSAILIYLYINLNCNLSSGVSHEIEYQQIADYFDWHSQTIYEAISELEFVGLINVKKRGGMILTLPDQGLIQEIAHQQKYEKQERKFYSEFQERVTSREFERGRSLDKSMILRMYDSFVEECGREKRWKPKEKVRLHLFEKLEQFAPLE